MEENLLSPGQDPKVKFEESPEGSDQESPSSDKRKVKDTVKSILKHAGNSARGVRHALSRKGSNEERNRDLPMQSDSSGEGSIPSPGYRPECEASPDIPDTGYRSSSLKSKDDPGQMDSSKAAMDLVSPSGEVKVDDRPDRLTMDTVDVNVTDKGEVDDSGRTAQETPIQFTENQVVYRCV